MNFMSILVAGAAQFCLAEPADPLCSQREVAAVEMTGERTLILRDIARRAAVNFRDEQGRADRWGADPARGDCEDKVLWQVRELRRRDPAIAAAARPVAILARTVRNRTQAHLVLVIETTRYPIVLDTTEPRPRSWDSSWRAVSPRGGMAGEWSEYQGLVAKTANVSSVAPPAD